MTERREWDVKRNWHFTLGWQARGSAMRATEQDLAGATQDLIKKACFSDRCKTHELSPSFLFTFPGYFFVVNVLTVSGVSWSNGSFLRGHLHSYGSSKTAAWWSEIGKHYGNFYMVPFGLQQAFKRLSELRFVYYYDIEITRIAVEINSHSSQHLVRTRQSDILWPQTHERFQFVKSVIFIVASVWLYLVPCTSSRMNVSVDENKRAMTSNFSLNVLCDDENQWCHWHCYEKNVVLLVL